MPWKEVTLMVEKRRFIALALVPGANISALCRDFTISRKTGYKILSRFKTDGEKGLVEHSRKPHVSPRKTSPELVEQIVAAKTLHPTWAGEKIKASIQKKGQAYVPDEKTIDRILKRHGFVSVEASRQHTPWQRFEHAAPNDLWQMDFKGHFATGASRCFPLTLLDDHSRYSLLIKACPDQGTATVKDSLTRLFHEQGLPKKMTMDNGSPWGYSGEQLHTRLTAWLMQLGIYVSHSRPYHPQTQGKLERFHRSLKLEVLSRYSFNNLEEAQEGFTMWQKIYNEERAHEGIGMKVPADRYERSPRVFSERLAEIFYPEGMLVRKVQYGGVLHIQGKEVRVGCAFHGLPVGLKEVSDGCFDVYFCQQKIKQIDLHNPTD